MTDKKKSKKILGINRFSNPFFMFDVVKKKCFLFVFRLVRIYLFFSFLYRDTRQTLDSEKEEKNKITLNYHAKFYIIKIFTT